MLRPRSRSVLVETEVQKIESQRDSPRKSKSSSGFERCLLPLLSVISAILIINLYHWMVASLGLDGERLGPVLISYSYFEKDPIQRENFEFFYSCRNCGIRDVC
eukprot:TRINITY_DN111306_c0_g1_i1.p2 TRINITY_DN111306_c0_g1~~TRINITY_DN111306_c0_g1_i1.p2  ORF type:complete len:119 (+),score=6.32 TRINITY_DN111306_c0_g1_i1:48-359(+)